MHKSLPYHDFLISHLKDPSSSALYIEAILEEKDPEPELLRIALGNMTPEQAKLHLEKLGELLSQPGAEAIYNLGNWLNALGLKLTVSVISEVDNSLTNMASSSEISV
jgi:DNA-binding phage protein